MLLLSLVPFQEVDIAGITMPVTKHNFIVKSVKELAETIRRAFYIAKIDSVFSAVTSFVISTNTGPGRPFFAI